MGTIEVGKTLTALALYNFFPFVELLICDAKFIMVLIYLHHLFKQTVPATCVAD